MKLEFSKSELEEYIEQCGFTDREISLINYKRRGFSVASIATYMDYSEKTINRITQSVIDKIIKYEMSKTPNE